MNILPVDAGKPVIIFMTRLPHGNKIAPVQFAQERQIGRGTHVTLSYEMKIRVVGLEPRQICVLQVASP